MNSVLLFFILYLVALMVYNRYSSESLCVTTDFGVVSDTPYSNYPNAVENYPEIYSR